MGNDEWLVMASVAINSYGPGYQSGRPSQGIKLGQLEAEVGFQRGNAHEWSVIEWMIKSWRMVMVVNKTMICLMMANDIISLCA